MVWEVSTLKQYTMTNDELQRAINGLKFMNQYDFVKSALLKLINMQVKRAMEYEDIQEEEQILKCHKCGSTKISETFDDTFTCMLCGEEVV